MTKTGTTFTLLLAGCAVLAASAVLAQGFQPARPIELVVHTGPGGGGDVLARALAVIIDKEKISPVRIQVNNKTGGGGLTAMHYLAEKKGENHTIAVFTGNWTTNPLVQAEAKITVQELTPIVRLLLEPALIVVKSDAPYKSMQELIEAAKKAPGQFKQSGGSITSRDNIVRLQLQKLTGAQWAYISFPGGGERIAALLGGHVNLMVVDTAEVGEHVHAGNMRVLAQVTERRLAGFAGVPTLKEAGYDVPLIPQVRGIVAPPGISKEAAAYYEDLFARVVRTASWKKYLEDNQFEDGFQKSAELRKFFDDFAQTMRVVLKEAGVKVVR